MTGSDERRMTDPSAPSPAITWLTAACDSVRCDLLLEWLDIFKCTGSVHGAIAAIRKGGWQCMSFSVLFRNSRVNSDVPP